MLTKKQGRLKTLIRKAELAIYNLRENPSSIPTKYQYNKTLVSKENNYKAIFPEINLCGDNAAMIAMVGLEKFKLKKFDDLDFKANPRWALDEEAKFLKGAGVKI